MFNVWNGLTAAPATAPVKARSVGASTCCERRVKVRDVHDLNPAVFLVVLDGGRHELIVGVVRTAFHMRVLLHAVLVAEQHADDLRAAVLVLVLDECRATNERA